MKHRILLITSIIAILMSTAFTPNLDTTRYTLGIINESIESVEIYLTNQDPDGPDYQFTAKPDAKSSRRIHKGVYDIEFTSCGITYSFTINMNKNKQIGIDECPGDPVRTKFNVNNHFEDAITVTLTNLDQIPNATENYSLESEFGRTRFDDLWSGRYIYSYDACDTTFTGIITISKSGISELTMKNCERLVYLDLGIQPVPVKVRIANHFSVGVTVTLIGPLSYFEDLSPGMNRVYLVPGTYTYIYAAHGVRYEGTFYVPPSGAGYLPIPYFIPDNAE